MPIALLFLAGLVLGWASACVAPAPTPILSTAAPGARLYTRTPTPTIVPVTPTPTLSSQILYQEGLTQRLGWNLDAALDRFDAALTLEPDSAFIYASRAELYRLAGRYEEAADDLQRALALDPHLAEAWRQKALLHRAEGAWEEALAAVNEFIQLRPAEGAAYALRAQIYLEGFDKIRLALADFERAITYDPTFEKATLVDRWHILARLNFWDRALTVSHRMFTSGSEDPLRYYYRGWSLIQLHQLDEAIQWLLFGLERYPDYPVALYYALGIAYYERRGWSEAIQALEVALVQSDRPPDGSAESTAWKKLGITTADILGPMGVAYLQMGQCETGAAILERAVAESAEPGAWGWATEQRIEACYLSLTPTPTPTLGPTDTPHAEQVPVTPQPEGEQ